MAMGDLAYSMQMRDTIARMVREEIETQRPRYRYAKVASIDRARKKCGVIFNGETGAVLVNMGSIQPTKVDQIVRVEGIGTDKFITDVIGGWGSGELVGTIAPYQAQGPVRVIWDGDASASGPYPLVMRGYRPRGGDRVSMIGTGDGPMIIPTGGDLSAVNAPYPYPTWYYVKDTVGFANNWRDYEVAWRNFYLYNDLNDAYPALPDWSWAGFSKSAAGIVKLRGLVSGGTTTSGTLIFTLPEGYRPSSVQAFPAQMADEPARIDIYPDGRVLVSKASANWTTLHNITFPAADAPGLSWTNIPSFLNGFSSYGGIYPAPAYWLDRNGFLHFRGLLRRTAGNPPPVTAMFAVPTAVRGTRATNQRVASGSFTSGNISLSGGVNYMWKAPSASDYISLDGLVTSTHEADAKVRWYNIPLVNGWAIWEADALNAFAIPQVAKTPDHFCYIRGTFKNGVTNPNNHWGNLPAGYLPKTSLLFGNVGADIGRRFDVKPNGRLEHSGGYAANEYLAVDGMSWFAEQ